MMLRLLELRDDTLPIFFRPPLAGHLGRDITDSVWRSRRIEQWHFDREVPMTLIAVSDRLLAFEWDLCFQCMLMVPDQLVGVPPEDVVQALSPDLARLNIEKPFEVPVDQHEPVFRVGKIDQTSGVVEESLAPA